MWRLNRYGRWFSFTWHWKASRERELKKTQSKVETYSDLSVSKPYIFLLSISFSLFFSPVSMSPSLWFKGCFSEVNHSRFQAPHHSCWRSLLYRVVRVNMGALKAVFLKDGTWTSELQYSVVISKCAFKLLLFKSQVDTMDTLLLPLNSLYPELIL